MDVSLSPLSVYVQQKIMAHPQSDFLPPQTPPLFLQSPLTSTSSLPLSPPPETPPPSTPPLSPSSLPLNLPPTTPPPPSPSGLPHLNIDLTTATFAPPPLVGVLISHTSTSASSSSSSTTPYLALPFSPGASSPLPSSISPSFSSSPAPSPTPHSTEPLAHSSQIVTKRKKKKDEDKAPITNSQELPNPRPLPQAPTIPAQQSGTRPRSGSFRLKELFNFASTSDSNLSKITSSQDLTTSSRALPQPPEITAQPTGTRPRSSSFQRLSGLFNPITPENPPSDSDSASGFSFRRRRKQAPEDAMPYPPKEVNAVVPQPPALPPQAPPLSPQKASTEEKDLEKPKPLFLGQINQLKGLSFTSEIRKVLKYINDEYINSGGQPNMIAIIYGIFPIMIKDIPAEKVSEFEKGYNALVTIAEVQKLAEAMAQARTNNTALPTLTQEQKDLLRSFVTLYPDNTLLPPLSAHAPTSEFLGLLTAFHTQVEFKPLRLAAKTYWEILSVQITLFNTLQLFTDPKLYQVIEQTEDFTAFMNGVNSFINASRQPLQKLGYTIEREGAVEKISGEPTRLTSSFDHFNKWMTVLYSLDFNKSIHPHAASLSHFGKILAKRPDFANINAEFIKTYEQQFGLEQGRGVPLSQSIMVVVQNLAKFPLLFKLAPPKEEEEPISLLPETLEYFNLLAVNAKVCVETMNNIVKLLE
jgi:hypothetical protein